MLRFDSSLLQPGYAVACSAGVDSTVVAHFLSKCKTKPAALWHFNHKLRCQNDWMEEKFRALSEYLGIPAVVDTAHEYPIKDERGFEHDARQARLAAMKARGFPSYVIAHHIDDAVETYLAGVFEGSNRRIPISTQMDGFQVVRPFLFSTKEQILRYAEHHQLEHKVEHDVTNDSITACTRNYLRHCVIPLLGHPRWNLRRVVTNLYKS